VIVLVAVTSNTNGKVTVKGEHQCPANYGGANRRAPSRNDLAPGAIHAGRRVLLDHLPYRPAIRLACESVTIVNDGLVDEATDRLHPTGPFHAQIIASFLLPDYHTGET
jgi:hypothetical protein